MLHVDIINQTWISKRQSGKKGIFITRETTIRKFRCFKPPVFRREIQKNQLEHSKK